MTDSPARALTAPLTRVQNWVESTLAPVATGDDDPADVSHGWWERIPADLAVLFNHVDHFPPRLLPDHDLLTLSGAHRIWTLWLEIIDDQRNRIPEYAAAYDPATLSAEPAGSPSELFLPEFIPFADLDGSTLFLDTRPGARSGCIAEYSATGASEGELWPSLTHLFTTLADSLESGTPFAGHHPTVTEATLHWHR
ncbi:hypothetical protein ACSVDM_12395 [Nocardia sp. JW2]|uniref:hypothetical protein n=1 Tax=Nocardia sp. JW2 TaxID=3450738 RepID=UPI003F440E50